MVDKWMIVLQGGLFKLVFTFVNVVFQEFYFASKEVNQPNFPALQQSLFSFFPKARQMPGGFHPSIFGCMLLFFLPYLFG